ncbi:MAG TPA: hypothetical protein VF526_18690 [Solirubrobacteraceae bacterium]|jgi:hypothetical protein
MAEPGELSAQERQELRRAHERLRAASQELQSLIATEPIKNRWEPEPAPPEILQAAKDSYQAAVERVAATQREILGWEEG